MRPFKILILFLLCLGTCYSQASPEKQLKQEDDGDKITGTYCVIVPSSKEESKVRIYKEWSSGEIYNPVEGKSYNSFLKFESATKPKVRGYTGVPALGKSMYRNKIE